MHYSTLVINKESYIKPSVRGQFVINKNYRSTTKIYNAKFVSGNVRIVSVNHDNITEIMHIKAKNAAYERNYKNITSSKNQRSGHISTHAKIILT